MLDALGDPLVVGTQALRHFGDARFRDRHRLGRPMRQCLVDTGGNDRNADDAVETLVEGRADDDVGILVDLFADARCRLVDFVEREITRRR